jgi:hypothetical protein
MPRRRAGAHGIAHDRSLPGQLVPLVGRQRELDDVVDALSRSRLVTLTGPGGTGW